MRKSTKHKILFFFLVLIGLIAGYTALYISVSRFNEKERRKNHACFILPDRNEGER